MVNSGRENGQLSSSQLWSHVVNSGREILQLCLVVFIQSSSRKWLIVAFVADSGRESSIVFKKRSVATTVHDD